MSAVLCTEAPDSEHLLNYHIRSHAQALSICCNQLSCSLSVQCNIQAHASFSETKITKSPLVSIQTHIVFVWNIAELNLESLTNFHHAARPNLWEWWSSWSWRRCWSLYWSCCCCWNRSRRILSLVTTVQQCNQSPGDGTKSNHQ